MILTERQIRRIISEEILSEKTATATYKPTTSTGTSSGEKVYVDDQGYKFAIRSGVLTLIGRPAAMGNKGLPKPIPSSMLSSTVTNLRKKYQSDAGLARLAGTAPAPGAVAAPTKVGPSDVSGVSMYGARVGDPQNYTEYRVYSNGLIKRFGVMKGGQWTMDDPAKDIPADKRVAVAQSILASNKYDSAAKASLDGIVSGKLTGTTAEDPGISLKLLSYVRKAMLAAGAPIAYVAFADYLLGRTNTWTANDLPANYQADLAKVAKYALTRKSPRTGKKGEILHDNAFVYNDFWRNASKKLGQGIPGTPLDGQGTKGTGTVEALEFFLGGMVVTQEGENYVIRDIYDYDDYFVSPKAYDEMSEFAGRLAQGSSFYDIVRKAAAFRQSTGYTGFPVEIRLPVSLAADFTV